MQFIEPGANGAAYSTATRSGNIIYIAGQVGEDRATGQFVTGSFEAEARLCLDNVKRAVEAAGGNMDNVLKITAYLTSATFFKDFNTIYRSYFKPDRLPARATVIVAALADPRLRVELDAVAVAEQGNFIPL